MRGAKKGALYVGSPKDLEGSKSISADSKGSKSLESRELNQQDKEE